ncbi:hypothetical protein MTO96_036974 [Rhipicephalus appendiculatus]
MGELLSRLLLGGRDSHRRSRCRAFVVPLPLPTPVSCMSRTSSCAFSEALAKSSASFEVSLPRVNKERRASSSRIPQTMRSRYIRSIVLPKMQLSASLLSSAMKSRTLSPSFCFRMKNA